MVGEAIRYEWQPDEKEEAQFLVKDGTFKNLDEYKRSSLLALARLRQQLTTEIAAL